MTTSVATNKPSYQQAYHIPLSCTVVFLEAMEDVTDPQPATLVAINFKEMIFLLWNSDPWSIITFPNLCATGKKGSVKVPEGEQCF